MKIKAVIDNKIKINNKDIPKEILKEIKEQLSYTNSKYYKIRSMGKSTRGIPQVLRSYTLEKGYISISRGAIHKIRKIVEEFNYTLQIEDKRVLKPYKEGFKSDINLRKYQRLCVKQGAFFQNCLIQGGCGSGKTIILLEILATLNQYTLVVVPTEVLLNQWIERAEKFLGIPRGEIGIWGGGKKQIKPLTIGIINSVNKDADKLAEAFGAVLVDEVHRSPASMFQDFLDKSKAYYRIGATATPYRKDNLQCLMYDQFGKIVYEIKKEVLKRDNILMNVEFIVIPTDLEFPEYNGDEKSKSYNDLLQKMITDEDRNELIMSLFKKEYEENHVSLILSDRLQFCHDWQEKLKNMGIESKLLIGGKDKKVVKEREDGIQMLNDKKLRVAFGTSVADEGLDVPILDRGFITTPTATNRRRIEQQVGRLERRADGKTDGKMFYFWDCKINGFDNHLHKLAKLFPEGKVFWEGEYISILEFRKKYFK